MTPDNQATYADMSDEQLNRVVAERLGWGIKEIPREGWCYVVPHNGKEVIMLRGFLSAERLEADPRMSEMLKKWASDNNAAAALDFGEYVLSIIVYGNRRTVQVANPERLAAYIEQDTRPEPRLRTEAWLMWRDAVNS